MRIICPKDAAKLPRIDRKSVVVNQRGKVWVRAALHYWRRILEPAYGYNMPFPEFATALGNLYLIWDCPGGPAVITLDHLSWELNEG